MSGEEEENAAELKIGDGSSLSLSLSLSLRVSLKCIRIQHAFRVFA